MPMVTWGSSRAGSGCQVRSRWSSRSSGSRRTTARIIISVYSAMGSLNTPRAFVMARLAARGLGRQESLDAGGRRMDPGKPGAASQEPVEAGRGHRTAEQDLDIVERAVREALERDAHEPGAGGGGSDPRQVLLAIARRQDGRQRDGAGLPAVSAWAGSPPPPARHHAPASDASDPGRRVVELPRPWAGCQAPSSSRCDGRRASGRWTPATKRSPRRYCSSLRSMPVRRARIRSIGTSSLAAPGLEAPTDVRHVRQEPRRRPRP